MKLSKDYKKHWLNILGYIFLLVFLAVPFYISSAQTINELESKINEKNSDIAQLEQEIAAYQAEINSISKKKNTLSASVRSLELTKKKLNADISVTQKKVDRTNLKIIELSLDINNKQGSISNNIEALSLEIRRIHEFDQNDAFALILSDTDLATVWNDLDSMASVSRKIRDTTNKLRVVKSNLEGTRDETAQAKAELEELRSKLSDQRKIVDQNRVEEQRLLNKTKNSESSYQKLLKDRLAKKNAIEDEIEAYESQIKYILDPSSLPGKGVLAWPLDKIYITQLFGKTKDSARLYASGSHSGVDFRAAVGTPVKSVSDGVVLGTGDTDDTCPGASFGKFVFIGHNNGLSTAYGHLSLIKAKEGQTVKRGEVIGYSGNTGHTTGPHLHLSVYVKDAAKMTTRPSKACEGRTYTLPLAPRTAYLDPSFYLPPYDN